MSKNMTALSPGMPWPSGDYIEAAVLNLSQADVEFITGCPMLVGVEKGLGPWKSIGLRLPSGTVVELISHEHDPLKGFTLRIDRGQDLVRIFREIYEIFGLTDDLVLWQLII